MADKKNKIIQLLKEKLEFLEGVDDIFLDEVEKVQKVILKKVLVVLRKLSQSGGKLKQDQLNNSFLLSLKRQILDIFRKSAFIPLVDDFVKNFDRSEKFNSDIYTLLLDEKKLNIKLSVHKRLFIDEVTGSLTRNTVLTKQFINPIRRTLVRAIQFGLTVSETKKLLEAFIVGQDGKLGEMRRYTNQVARDAVNRFDGLQQDLVRDAYDLNGFHYLGVIVDNSRPFCRHLLNAPDPVILPKRKKDKEVRIQENWFKEFALGDGKYKVEDIPKIIESGRGTPGFNEEITPETFATYRGGYSCLHQVIYTKLSDKTLNNIKL